MTCQNCRSTKKPFITGAPKFTEKELKMMSMKIKGHSNKDIAAEMNVSEPDVSQTLARMRSKITSVKDSVALLTQIGILHEGPKLVLTEKGREFSTNLYVKNVGVRKQVK